MSNHLAIATVSAALAARVQEALDTDVSGATVRLGRPDGEASQDKKSRVNIYLYQVSTNPAMRNTHLPTRGNGARLIARPRVAIDLHYLFSFYGDSPTFQPELMLGSVTRLMEEEPLLSRKRIEKVIQDNQQTLGQSDLHKAPELARATFEALNLEELSKLWSVFFQVPYAMSVAYQLSYVLVESKETAVPPQPVTRPSFTRFLLPGPSISVVEVVAGAVFHIVWGARIRIRGRGLGAHGLGLRIGAASVAMSLAEVSAEEIECTLSTGLFGGTELAAGVHLVRTVLPPEPPASAHLERVSDAVPMILRPSLSLPAGAVSTDPAPANKPVNGSVKVTFTPKVAKGQEVRLLLDERVKTSPVSTQLAPNAIPDSSYPSSELTFAFKSLKRATYLVRAIVDGVASAPEIDINPTSPSYLEITGPEVVIP